MAETRLCLLLLPHTLERFILYDTAKDLLRSPGVLAVEAPRVPYGAFGRLPEGMAFFLGMRQAGRMRLRGDPRAVAIFHPLQLPTALGLLARFPDCQLWYGLSDRYDHTPGANPGLLARVAKWHVQASERSSLTFAVSTTLCEVERSEGRDCIVMPSAADAFPAPDPDEAVVAMSFGHHGKRTDWKLLRTLCERMGDELVLLIVGKVHEQECKDDPDYQALRAAPGAVWLGRRSDEESARLFALADVGVGPFLVDDYNHAALPNRILKAARLGRRTIMPPLTGVDVWSDAVVRPADLEGWIEALRAEKGVRSRAHRDLRAWALAQTGERQNQPLWERLRELGVAGPAS